MCKRGCQCNKCCNNNRPPTSIDIGKGGKSGESAYQIALRRGKTTTATEDEWLDEFPKGEKGDVYIPVLSNNYFDI